MYIYNETLNIDEQIHEEWLLWNVSHIQKVLATGCFTRAKMTQVLINEQMGGVTYSIQYKAVSLDKIREFQQEYEQILHQEVLRKFGDRVLCFRTELKLIQEFFPQSVTN